MAKNTGNLNDGSDTLALARQDLYDMATDIGYRSTGDVSPISTTGGCNKIVKTDESGKISAGEGGVESNGTVVIQKTSGAALEIKDGLGGLVFKVNTATSNGKGITRLSGEYSISAFGQFYPGEAFKVTAVNVAIPSEYCEYVGLCNGAATLTLTLISNNVLTMTTNANGNLTCSKTGTALSIEVF